ncbi:hypothetical protein CTAYLR_005397 [Chrysophaeum taylorii]|uniref:Uncharacterized protein n=1 Tax=Chrysophaeum taylorii TaxID=2483200 RepID=A0AAD7XFS5_9STRA|nr:hypothetical protein CTAYLR_005397 [Chrysophaeum taylorii]
MKKFVTIFLPLAAAAAFGFAPLKQQRPPRGRGATREVTQGELLRFGLPALALWVSGPLLTLIDTSAVGITSKDSALDIAALGPATSLCDAAGYVFAFLNVAATNLLASSTTREERLNVAARGLALAAWCGLATTLLLRVFGRWALAVFVGADASVIEKAASYVDARALGMSFLLASNVLTACLLGAKNSIAPLRAQFASASANVIGDYVAVAVLGRGVRGAAEATFGAQIVSALVLARAARKTLGKDFILWRTAPAGYAAFAAPVLVLVISKIASFGAMTHAASALGRVPLAAHQLSFTFYLLASLVMEALAAQTAQAFLPPLKGTPACKDVSSAIFNFAAIASVFVSAACFAFASFAAPLFSSDPAIAATLSTLAAPLSISVLLHAAVAHGEGVMIALGDLKAVGAAYALSALVFPPIALAASHRILFPNLLPDGAAIWRFFALFQLARAITFQFRAATLLLNDDNNPR